MNHEAIYWKVNNTPGISIVGDTIRDWPESLGKKPDKATIAKWEQEYLVYKEGADVKEAAKAKLVELDLASVRGLREWVAKQADAPAQIKDYEAQAIAERGKL